MPCEGMLQYGQTVVQRRAELAAAAKKAARLLAMKKIGLKIGPRGVVMFTGLADEDRKGANDACIYNRIKGDPAVRAAVLRAEAMSGVKVNARLVAQGGHSHDGVTVGLD